MKDYYFILILTAAFAFYLATSRQKVFARTSSPHGIEATEIASSPEGKAKFVTDIPPGYRDWKLVSVAHEEGSLNDIRAILGNDLAIQAYREGTLPFPDGSIIARVAWCYTAAEENNKIFGRTQSWVAGPPTNGVQFMVRDSKKYAATGGWGFAHFNNGKSADEKMLQSCFPCHQALQSRDLVFTRYSP